MNNFTKINCYCIKLRRAANIVSDIYDHCLDSMGLSITQYSLLGNLQKIESCSVTDLANYIGLERTTVVRTIRPLFSKGLISDASAPNQRNKILQLTEKGEKILEQCKILWRDAQEEVEKRIGKENADMLMKILDQINDG
ncbi:MarR family winged helix-turn-helix transcriptional regulator [Bariatricus sp. SGI.154]|uniref:MarR family winged helix-turn-helix transcriptional regulator n=1 Tax=Bariatricus sp. SGI.154 TaxID=3420549 RepID=UPI003D04955E